MKRLLVALTLVVSPAALAYDRTAIDEAMHHEQFGAAVVLCKQALEGTGSSADPRGAPGRAAGGSAEGTGGPTDFELRATCARAHVGLGDRLRDAGSLANARLRWEEAATLDPRLMDDPDFVKRLTDTPVRPVAPPVTPTPTPHATPRPVPRPIQKGPPPRPPKVRTATDGPRFDRGFGVGLSFGYDGLASATVSWLSNQHYLIEVAFGLAYPSADVRFRWLGLKHCLTPYLGAGLFVPFGKDDRLGLDISSYESLYELGESFHVDLGLAWMPVEGLDISAGVAFVTPFDQDHPDTVLFFPQLSAGITWRF